jgi:hypothetical protein
MVQMDKQHLIKYALMIIVLSKFINWYKTVKLFIFIYINRIALKCLDYQDKTLLTNSVSGSVALQLRLLNSLGYKCVPVCLEFYSKGNHLIFFLYL